LEQFTVFPSAFAVQFFKAEGGGDFIYFLFFYFFCAPRAYYTVFSGAGVVSGTLRPAV
jgi:heme/copper-type cytochrome/quinol oxidase subunit 1